MPAEPRSAPSPLSAPRPFAVRPFHPPWWLRGAHAQTVGGKLLRPDLRLGFRRERLETPDGDFVDLDWLDAPVSDAPVVLVLHGLEGSARRHYMQTTYAALAGAGLRPVGLNFRSCSGEPNRAPRLYHSGDTADLRFALEHLVRQAPGGRRAAVGFSLGGNVLLKMLGEEGRRATRLLSAAVAVSVPFDLAAGADQLARGVWGRIYSGYFLRMLRRKVAERGTLLDDRCDTRRAARARTLREFDDAATAPLHGFTDAADYYRRSSSAGFLRSIRVPTLLLQSLDDPFLPRTAVPWDAAARNPWITAGFTPAGGHVGFVAGRSPRAPEFWAEAEAARFIAEQLGGM